MRAWPEKGHERKLLGLVALGTTTKLSQGQIGFVPGKKKNPDFRLTFYNGRPV